MAAVLEAEKKNERERELALDEIAAELRTKDSEEESENACVDINISGDIWQVKCPNCGTLTEFDIDSL